MNRHSRIDWNGSMKLITQKSYFPFHFLVRPHNLCFKMFLAYRMVNVRTAFEQIIITVHCDTSVPEGHLETL